MLSYFLEGTNKQNQIKGRLLTCANIPNKINICFLKCCTILLHDLKNTKTHFFTFSSISEFIDDLFKNRFDDLNHEIIIRSFQNYIMNHQKDSQISKYCALMSDLFLEFLYYKIDQIAPIKE